MSSLTLQSILNLRPFIQLAFFTWMVSPSSQTVDPTNQMCSHDTVNVNYWADVMTNLTYLSQSLDTERFGHNLTTVCPSLPHQEHTGLANQLSLCPWTYEIDTDYNRFPHLMPYARCRCGTCPSRDPFQVHHRCQPLYHGFQVVRRVCEDGHYRFHYTNEMLPVACVCSHRNIRFVPHGHL